MTPVTTLDCLPLNSVSKVNSVSILTHYKLLPTKSCCRRLQLAPPQLHSATSCQQPPEWLVVGQINWFSPWQPVRVKVVLHHLHPEDPIAWRPFYANCTGYQYASELLSRQLCWYTNVGTAWLRHTCRHTASQHHHTVVGVTCALQSPVNSLFHVRGQTTETAVLPFTGQSCGTLFQPISVCWTFHCQCSGNDWKCSCSRITVIVQRPTWRICCVGEVCAL